MQDLPDFQQEISRLLKEGRRAEALRFAEACIEKARAENQVVWVETLTAFALVVAEATGDVALVKQYAERAFCGPPERPAGKARALFAIADVLFRNGDTGSAKQHAAMSYALVAHGDTESERSLRDLILYKWPKVAEW